MKISHAITLVAALALPQILSAKEKEEAVKLDRIPAAAARAIKTASGGAKLTGLSKEMEDGAVAYEAGWLVKGRKKEVTVAADGKVLAVEQTIALDEAPKAVRESIAKETGDGHVTGVERVEEKGKTTYEALIKMRKGSVEVVLDPKGKVVKREKKPKQD
jgi:hypothetical protein